VKQYNPEWNKFGKYNYENNESYESKRRKELAREEGVDPGNLTLENDFTVKRVGKVEGPIKLSINNSDEHISFSKHCPIDERAPLILDH
jgi:hypothetical protein